jgi:hypothetical protein
VRPPQPAPETDSHHIGLGHIKHGETDGVHTPGHGKNPGHSGSHGHGGGHGGGDGKEHGKHSH